MKKTFITTLFLIALAVAGYTLVSAQGDAELELQSSATQADSGDEFTVDVVLKNPDAESVISVRSWLEYDATALEADSIDTSSSLFTLSAPGEDEVSSEEDHIKIGRSNISGGVTDTETTVATITFKVLATSAQTSEISFYDYQVSELGHTSVNIIESGFPVNILSEEPESIKISLNPGATTTTTTTTPVTTTTATDTGVGGGTVTISATLLPPDDLTANTGSGYIDLEWDAPEDSERSGFNIYYGKVSGQYSRRRNIGEYDNYRLDGLTDDETYYLAVTAYDLYNQESEYSNEVGIIVNEPLSSTHPFTSLVSTALAAIPTQPQNGPLAGWLILSAAGLGSAIVYRKRKHRRTESAIG